MNVLQHTRNERNPCLKQNRLDRSYRDTLLTSQRNCAEFESSCQNKKNWKCLNFLVIIIIIYFLYIKQSIYSKGRKVEFSEIASN